LQVQVEERARLIEESAPEGKKVDEKDEINAAI
jgi:hypothetical protein